MKYIFWFFIGRCEKFYYPQNVSGHRTLEESLGAAFSGTVHPPCSPYIVIDQAWVLFRWRAPADFVLLFEYVFHLSPQGIAVVHLLLDSSCRKVGLFLSTDLLQEDRETWIEFFWIVFGCTEAEVIEGRSRRCWHLSRGIPSLRARP